MKMKRERDTAADTHAIQKMLNTCRNDYIEYLLFTKSSSIIPTFSNKKGTDFFINGIPFDQKVSSSPTGQFVKAYGDDYKKEARDHPEELAKYLYQYQDPGRFDFNCRILFVYLNNVPKVTGGFIEQNYSPAGIAKRMYFTIGNSEKADAIRQEIEKWYRDEKLTDDEYYYLLNIFLSALDQCANTTSVYGAYLKQFKKTALAEINLVKKDISADGKSHRVYNEDADVLVRKIKADVFYLDPPYNTRQYASNYHVLEMAARYDPKVILHGKTGLYDYSNQKSEFSSKQRVKEAFSNLIKSIDGNYIFLSYNDEGILPLSDIKEIMSTRGDYGFFTQTYHRYKADSKRSQKQIGTTEYLHYVKVKK